MGITVAINIRNVPDELAFAAKMRAASRKQDLREYIIDLLRVDTAEMIVATPRNFSDGLKTLKSKGRGNAG